jgi:hypothetical protein
VDIEVTAADLRAELARLNLPRYVIAARAGVHPSKLGAVLSERDRLSPGLAEAVLKVISEERSARGVPA